MSAWVCPTCGMGNDYREFENICENCGHCFSCGQISQKPISEPNTRMSKRDVAAILDAIRSHIADASRMISYLRDAHVSFYGSININGTKIDLSERTLLSFDFDNVSQEYPDVTSKDDACSQSISFDTA